MAVERTSTQSLHDLTFLLLLIEAICTVPLAIYINGSSLHGGALAIHGLISIVYLFIGECLFGRTILGACLLSFAIKRNPRNMILVAGAYYSAFLLSIGLYYVLKPYVPGMPALFESRQLLGSVFGCEAIISLILALVVGLRTFLRSRILAKPSVLRPERPPRHIW